MKNKEEKKVTKKAAAKVVKPKAAVKEIKSVVQGVNLEEAKNNSLLDFVNGGPQKIVYGEMSDLQFDVKMRLASFEELMKMAVKLGVVPCADIRRLKQSIVAKRQKIKDSEGRRTDKITPKTSSAPKDTDKQ